MTDPGLVRRLLEVAAGCPLALGLLELLARRLSERRVAALLELHERAP